MKPCKKFEERISEMLLGEIPENEEHMLHIHMAACDGCMDFYLSLYETLEVDDSEEFALTEEQKSQIFERAEKLDKPIKKLSPFWTTGVSIAASLVVSGIIILSKGYKKEPKSSYLYEEKSKAADFEGEVKVVKNDVQYIEIEEPKKSLREGDKNEDPAQEALEPVSKYYAKQDKLNSPVLSTVHLESVETNDAALEDATDEAPSTVDKMTDRTISEIVVSPSAFAAPNVFGGRGEEGRQKEEKEAEKDEGLDLVLDGKALEFEGLGSSTRFDDNKNSSNKSNTYQIAAGDKTKKDTLNFGTMPGEDIGGYIHSPDQQGQSGEFSLSLNYVQGKEKNLWRGVEDKEDFKDKGGSRIWYNIEDSNGKDLENGIQENLAHAKDHLEQALVEDPFNAEVVGKLRELNKKILATGRQRRVNAEYTDEVEFKWNESVDEDKVGKLRLQNEFALTGDIEKRVLEERKKIILNSENEKKVDEVFRQNKEVEEVGKKLQESQDGDLSKIESALKQQRELEADNKFLNAQKLQRDGNLEGARQELEAAITKLKELPGEPRVTAKKEKYLELYSSLVQPETSKRPMLSTQTQPMSTFSIDVDTASYQRAKQMIQSGQRPEALSIRAEEFINSFDYKYEAPKDKAFAVHSEVVNSAFHRGSKIMKIGIQGKRPGGDHRAASHFCFIVDTSGSMADKNRLPMVKKVLPMIIKQMSPGDKISLISCGLNSRLELDHTDIQNAEHIAKRIESLNAVGATNLEASLLDGYRQILKHIKKGTYSRVILFSDGVANLGEQNAKNILEKIAYAKSEGVGISVIGMGEEEYNDNFLETLADNGDGNYVYIGNSKEAQKTFEEKFAATFHTIAYNVKIQVEFDPAQVSTYRLLGYENRRLKNQDFRNDKVDAGEVGSGQSVTAIYEIEMSGKPSSKPMAEVRLRYRDAVDSQMKEFSTPVLQNSYNVPFETSSEATRLAFISGKFAEVLRDGGSSEGITVESLLKYMRPLASESNNEDIKELMYLIEKSR